MDGTSRAPSEYHPRSRSLLIVLGTFLIAAGAVFSTALVAVSADTVSGFSREAQIIADVVLYGATLVPLVAGAYLVRRGSPEFPISTLRWARGLPGRVPRVTPRELLRQLATPLGVLALAAVLSVSLVLLAGPWGAVATVFVLTAYCIAGPLASALGGRWWADTVLSAVGFAVLFIAVLQAKAVGDLREGAMVFMLPMIIYPVAVPLSGLLRLMLWHRGRRAREGGAPTC